MKVKKYFNYLRNKYYLVKHVVNRPLKKFEKVTSSILDEKYEEKNPAPPK